MLVSLSLSHYEDTEPRLISVTVWIRSRVDSVTATTPRDSTRSLLPCRSLPPSHSSTTSSLSTLDLGPLPRLTPCMATHPTNCMTPVLRSTATPLTTSSNSGGLSLLLHRTLRKPSPQAGETSNSNAFPKPEVPLDNSSALANLILQFQ